MSDLSYPYPTEPEAGDRFDEPYTELLEPELEDSAELSLEEELALLEE